MNSFDRFRDDWDEDGSTGSGEIKDCIDRKLGTSYSMAHMSDARSFPMTLISWTLLVTFAKAFTLKYHLPIDFCLDCSAPLKS